MDTRTQILALTCVLAPLAGFAIAILGFRRRHAAASAIVIFSGVVTLVSSLLLLFGSGSEGVVSSAWFTIGDTSIDFGILLDGRTTIMGAVVALITLCIEVYSLSYMRGDPGLGRFFAFLAFFEWSMLAFVFASSLLQTFIFWELVGLASFLLIGFWYEKPSAVAAAKKAFVMTRIGDVGLFIGLILLFQLSGTLDVVAINGMFAGGQAPATVDAASVELITLLLFVGVIGKSAQFPLHTWLPDAMEGPTPVSALLHSATMVAAGVFLVARFHDVFMAAPGTMRIMLTIAVVTALLASTMAMVAKDMKRVLAFSSISQLGFMLMGLAAGSLFAGFFHLTTHAFFKALLFLCAGAFIHHAGSNDMIAMGRARATKMRVATIGVVVGGAALAGIPPLAGFFSKEQIIGSLHDQMLFKVAALAAAFLTAYYSFRMIFLLVRPNEGSQAVPDEAPHAQHGDDHHEHPESPWMQAPILLLTLGALGAGFIGGWIGHRLHVEVHHPSIGEMAPAVVIALAGVALAWFDFGRAAAPQTGFIALFGGLKRLFENRWYVDEIYRVTFVRAALFVASFCYGTETKGIDATVDAVAGSTVDAGGTVARSHRGRLQVYIGVAAIIVALLVFGLASGDASTGAGEVTP